MRRLPARTCYWILLFILVVIFGPIGCGDDESNPTCDPSCDADQCMVCRDSTCVSSCATDQICDNGTCVEKTKTVSPPFDLRAESLETSIRLVWQHAEAANFRVLRRSESEDEFRILPESTPGSKSFEDMHVLPGKTYTYAIVALLDSQESEPSDEVQARTTGEPADWTLIYFISSDGDYGYDYWFNIEGLEAQGGSSESIHVLVLYDGFQVGDSRYYRLGGSNLSREKFTIPTAPDGEVNMGDAQTYRDCIDWLLPRYAARHYFVSFHNHGGGSVEPGSPSTGTRLIHNMLYDQTSADSLDPDEQGQVIAHLAREAEQQVDVVESMTCLGQMVENTYAMAGHARFHVGAESLSYVSSTFPVAYLRDHPQASAEDVATFLVDDHHQGMVAGHTPCAWSLVDLDKLEGVVDSMSSLAAGLLEFASTSENQSLLRELAGQAQNFQFYPGDLMSAYVDIRDWARVLSESADLPAPLVVEAASLVETFDEGLVLANRVHNDTHPGFDIEAHYDGAYGLSVYHPNLHQPFYQQPSTPPYAELSFCRNTGWAEYLQAISLEAPEGPCPKVTNLQTVLQADDAVHITWSYPRDQEPFYDGFYCSRDKDGVFSGVYFTLLKQAGMTDFEVVDTLDGPGVYTWRVTAVRFSDQEGSINWSTSEEMTLSK
ncbi:MAG: hypothetical protein JRF33_19695 [Deltaproteobacteria bacterium]|nr:hypothetical protein [Deltaproteobacteria bacterium]